MTLVVATLVSSAVLLLLPAGSTSRLHRLALPSAPVVSLDLRQRVNDVRGGSRQRRLLLEQAIDALASLAAELEAGQPPDRALQFATGGEAVWPIALSAARMGGDIPAALEADARLLPLLRQVAACWRLGGTAGASLGPSIARLATAARQGEELQAVLAAELASPRATMRMLSLLPLIGIALGVLLGADPLGWLLRTPAGWACLVAGLALNAVGAWWSHRLVVAVERRL